MTKDRREFSLIVKGNALAKNSWHYKVYGPEPKAFHDEIFAVEIDEETEAVYNKDDVATFSNLLEEMSSYLDGHKNNTIGSRSIFHSRMKEALEKWRQSE